MEWEITMDMLTVNGIPFLIFGLGFLGLICWGGMRGKKRRRS
jgi:hypothetical protein